ncbi:MULTISPECIES: NADPH-dependent F420 reductase [Streptomyces]|uniref:NADPH-dependent F420 reductase n=1 Tax=Streptomyces TaxID=1883 RepID=UPI0016744F18|nr:MULTISPECIES: NAD(P)-binding domain-containing protein [Streptomyces]MBK3527818.1 NAD(P)-binding domain-containing protein [Streptomyces sp. MBT70]GGR95439.1 DNA-binding protein [Streptomyces eurythermus]
MNYAVIGTGIVGRTLAAKLSDLGHKVTIGTRDVRRTLENTEPDGYGNEPFSVWSAAHPDIALATFEEAASTAETVVNATAGMSSLDALRAAGADNLAGKLLIDVANPLDFSQGMPPFLNPVGTDSLGEQIQRAFPDARVVKTLNTMNCSVMVEPSLVPGDHHVFLCGNDADAKEQVSRLLLAFGWPEDALIDLGDITASRATEQTLPLWIQLWTSLGHWNFNFRIQQAG